MMGLFLWISLLSPVWIISGVEGGEDDVVAGDTQDRHGGGEHYQGTVKPLLYDDPPGPGDHGDVLAPCHLDSVMDRACKDGGAGALGDEDEVQPGGEEGRCKGTMAPERVPEFLARVCFTNMLKTIIFFLPGMWAVVAILALLYCWGGCLPWSRQASCQT